MYSKECLWFSLSVVFPIAKETHHKKIHACITCMWYMHVFIFMHVTIFQGKLSSFLESSFIRYQTYSHHAFKDQRMADFSWDKPGPHSSKSWKELWKFLLDVLCGFRFIITFTTWNSNLVPLLEGLCSSNPCRFEFPIFWVFAGIEPTTSGLTVLRSDQLS